jgi:hypothetical protein
MESFKQKFRSEYICLQCKTVYEVEPVRCFTELSNGKLCGGAICVRIFRVH